MFENDFKIIKITPIIFKSLKHIFLIIQINFNHTKITFYSI